KSREKNLTIILIGLDNAGKTTLLYGLRNELPKADVTPTIGFRPSKLVSGKYTIQWFDVGGAKNFRRVWQKYYPEVHGVIFVVDAANAERFEEARESLEQV
ncbi:ADP-ribosylation factor family-domain-containing protein, partial [Baffinella frigidus]